MKKIKEKNGVSIYKEGKKYMMYIEEMKILEIDEKFKFMLDKSFDNLVKIRAEENKK